MRIGELAAQTGLSRDTLRFYEKAGLLHPRRRPGGYRDYGEAELARVALIKQAKAAGLTLREIRALVALVDEGEAPCAHARALIAAKRAQIEAQIRSLEALKARLDALLAWAEAHPEAPCPGAPCVYLPAPED